MKVKSHSYHVLMHCMSVCLLVSCLIPYPVTLLHPILTLHTEFTLFSLDFPENAALLLIAPFARLCSDTLYILSVCFLVSCLIP